MTVDLVGIFFTLFCFSGRCCSLFSYFLESNTTKRIYRDLPVARVYRSSSSVIPPTPVIPTSNLFFFPFSFSPGYICSSIHAKSPLRLHPWLHSCSFFSPRTILFFSFFFFSRFLFSSFLSFFFPVFFFPFSCHSLSLFLISIFVPLDHNSPKLQPQPHPIIMAGIFRTIYDWLLRMFW